ncbi:MAG: beta-hydroxyacyl-ACP dehydratase [Acidobacteria bacterium]|nr:beta-hydroxyacyl-ACP dehydratase [Acidobacteriota bacterium]MCI0621728.1 beta-hydroxyacyl-ACP dehydratase [Acidobacteriota bacterium]MCI0718384.1 beta-hydroxyacyl-ACP dehydratase [Acidobacteriota bacterium]
MRFILVDDILELDPAKRIVATKFVSSDEDYFPDHFPGYPVVPGVLLVEMVAQAAARCLLAGIDQTLWPVFLQIRNANFRKAVRPESHLVIEATVESCNQKTSGVKGRVLCEGEVMADTSVLLGFISRSFLPSDFEDEVLRNYFQRLR